MGDVVGWVLTVVMGLMLLRVIVGWLNAREFCRQCGDRLDRAQADSEQQQSGGG